jgi:hypothetical protein
MHLKFYIFIYHFKCFLTNRTIFLNLVGMPVGSIMNSVHCCIVTYKKFSGFQRDTDTEIVMLLATIYISSESSHSVIVSRLSCCNFCLMYRRPLLRTPLWILVSV